MCSKVSARQPSYVIRLVFARSDYCDAEITLTFGGHGRRFRFDAFSM